MARKITTDTVNAFMSAKPFSRANSSVYVELDIVTHEQLEVFMSLHGHDIARRKIGSNDIEVTNADYFTNTTKERLNGLPGVSVCQRKGVWFLNGEEWDGTWKVVA